MFCLVVRGSRNIFVRNILSSPVGLRLLIRWKRLVGLDGLSLLACRAPQGWESQRVGGFWVESESDFFV